MSFFKRLFGRRDKQDDRVKSLYDELDAHPEKDFRYLGTQPIETDKIVGSVGRANELDSGFNYRDRPNTGRYRRVELAAKQGKPSDPIKVVRLKSDPKKRTQFFVMDGHHRVAFAKKRKLSHMDAEVTDVVLPETDDPSDEEAGADAG